LAVSCGDPALPQAANLLRATAGVALYGCVGSAHTHGGGGQPPERVAAGPVLLRRLRADDAEAVARAVEASLEHLGPWATLEASDTASQRAWIIEADGLWEAATDFIYAVLRARGGAKAAAAVADGELIGTFGLHRRIGPFAIEMGYWIHAAYAGRGFGTAAARALTPVALALPDVHRVEIHCDVANAASAAIPRGLGYRLDRIEQRGPQAPAETGRHMVWVLERAAGQRPARLSGRSDGDRLAVHSATERGVGRFRAVPRRLGVQQLARPQRDFEAKPCVGIVQDRTEEFVELPEPVPDGLRMDVQAPRHLLGVAGVLQPGQERFRQPVLLRGPQAPQRREPDGAQRAGKLLIRQDQQRGQMLVAADDLVGPGDYSALGKRKRVARQA